MTNTNNTAINSTTKYAAPAGRILLAAIFVMSGFSKITAYADTQGYMESVGLPGGLLPLVIALEILGGLAIILGFKARWVALVMAGFSIVSAFMFHMDFGDQMQMMHFMKNLAMAGGFLMITAHGAGALSIDNAKGDSKNVVDNNHYASSTTV